MRYTAPELPDRVSDVAKPITDVQIPIHAWMQRRDLCACSSPVCLESGSDRLRDFFLRTVGRCGPWIRREWRLSRRSRGSRRTSRTSRASHLRWASGRCRPPPRYFTTLIKGSDLGALCCGTRTAARPLRHGSWTVYQHFTHDHAKLVTASGHAVRG